MEDEQGTHSCGRRRGRHQTRVADRSIAPSLVGQLLLGEKLAGIAIPVARVGGIALVDLGIACWPGAAPLVGMLTYSTVVALYLAYLGFAAGLAGVLLWPAVALHVPRAPGSGRFGLLSGHFL
jgi:hypothetical protein